MDKVIIIIAVILIALFFRFEKAEVGYYQIRHDRYFGTIEIKTYNGNWFKTGMKSMQQAKAYLQQQELEKAVENVLGR